MWISSIKTICLRELKTWKFCISADTLTPHYPNGLYIHQQQKTCKEYSLVPPEKPHHQFAAIPGKESLTWTNFLIGCLALQASITQQQGTTTAHIPSGLINIWTILAKLILLSPYQKIALEDCTLTHKSCKKVSLNLQTIFFPSQLIPSLEPEA